MEKSSTKTLIVVAVIIAIGLVAIGVGVKSGLNSMADNSRTVMVKGLAEKEVKANKVTWPISFKLTGNNLVEIYKDVSNGNKVVKDFLVSNGIGADEITVNAPQIIDKDAQEYSSNQGAFRYIVTSTSTVATSKVDVVRQLMSRQGELLTKGVAIVANDYNNQIVYEFTDLNKIKPEMIEAATKNARQAAEKFAKDSESSLGKIKDATQGQFSIDDRDANTPFIKKVRVVSTINYYLKD